MGRKKSCPVSVGKGTMNRNFNWIIYNRKGIFFRIPCFTSSKCQRSKFCIKNRNHTGFCKKMKLRNIKLPDTEDEM